MLLLLFAAALCAVTVVLFLVSLGRATRTSQIVIGLMAAASVGFASWLLIGLRAAEDARDGPARAPIRDRRDEPDAARPAGPPVKVTTDLARSLWAEPLPEMRSGGHTAVGVDPADGSVGFAHAGYLMEPGTLFGRPVPVTTRDWHGLALFGWKPRRGEPWARVAETVLQPAGMMVASGRLWLGALVDDEWLWRDGATLKPWKADGASVLEIAIDPLDDHAHTAPPDDVGSGWLLPGAGNAIEFHVVTGYMGRVAVTGFEGSKPTWSYDVAASTTQGSIRGASRAGDEVAVCLWVKGTELDLGPGRGPRRPLPGFPPVDGDAGGEVVVWFGAGGKVTTVLPWRTGVVEQEACFAFTATTAGFTAVGVDGHGLDLVARDGTRAPIDADMLAPMVITSDSATRIVTVAQNSEDDETTAITVFGGQPVSRQLRFAVPFLVGDIALAGDVLAIAGDRDTALDLGVPDAEPLSAPKSDSAPFIWALQLPATGP